LSTVIRLTRTGRKKVARYRIVAADGRMKRDGRFLEAIGTYNPQASPKEFSYDLERMAHWVSKGAKVSETIANLLRQDRFSEKIEGMKKGLTPEQLALERFAERARKAKPRGKKEKKGS
jgi:small subunit ribosomal protein S16